jgi:hypothetical protein
MSGLSDKSEVDVLNLLLRNVAVSEVSPFVGLNVSDPTDAGNDTELSDPAYLRQAAVFAAPSSGPGTTQNTGDLTYPAISVGGPYTITHVSIWDAPTFGNMLMSEALNASKAFSIGDVPRFPTGALTVTAS